MKKWISAITLLGVGLMLFWLLRDYLTLSALQQQLSTFKTWHSEHPIFVIGAFFIAYVLMTALSFPGATLLTLLGGALFGLSQGLLIISFASSLGATVAFLGARYFFRDWVQARFQQRLAAFNRGIEKDGAFYLFTLRLVPIFPFFVINLLMGLTPIRTWTFYWVSQVGMLLGTTVYVNAGTQMAQIETLSGIVSPSLVLSFALLGLFPWLAKALILVVQKRQVYRGYSRPKHYDRNLIVIGGGAAGLVSAYIASMVKAKVTLIESHVMGGDCLNYGCVPSKALIKSAKIAQQMRQAERYGIAANEPQIELTAVMARLRNIIDTIAPNDSVERYQKLGVEVLSGHAKLIDPWTVAIHQANGEEQLLTARHIILATGARPIIPNLPGLDLIPYATSETLWSTLETFKTFPKRLLILGGGPIGCELAQAFQRLGSQVTLVEKHERLLRKEDIDVSRHIEQRLTEEGVTLHLSCEVSSFEEADGQARARLQTAQNPPFECEFDLVLLALGREARLEGLGLEALGITGDRTIEHNEYLETRMPHILVAGDAAGPYQFTHVAAHQAWYASVNALFGQFKRFKADYRVIPTVTYTDPQVARVGLNEQEAQAKGIAYEVTQFDIGHLDRAITESAAYGSVKIFTVPNKDRILGVCIIAEQAGEMLPEFVIAMKHGLGLNKILATVHAYPTWAEANKYGAGEWKKRHAPEALMPLLKRYHRWRRDSL